MEIHKEIVDSDIHGPPDFLIVDQGTAYISKETKDFMEEAGIILEEALIENPGSIGIVERYHAPLRSYFTKLIQSLPKSTAIDPECLQMAVYAANATIGSEGL